MHEQVKCKQCGWANQAGQATCSWCQAPLELPAGAQPAVASPVGPPALNPDIPPPQAQYAAPPPGYYLGADGKYYPFPPQVYTRSQAKSAWVTAGWVAFFVFVVPFVVFAGMMALCFASLGAGSGSSGQASAAATPVILLIVGGVALLLLVVFSTRRGRQ